MKPRPVEDVAREIMIRWANANIKPALGLHPSNVDAVQRLFEELREALAERMKNPEPIGNMLERIETKIDAIKERQG